MNPDKDIPVWFEWFYIISSSIILVLAVIAFAEASVLVVKGLLVLFIAYVIMSLIIMAFYRL